MKAVVISDIHGSGYYAEKIKEINERENPDKIILLGDLYYHGPRNELSQEYKPMKVAEILNSLKDKLLVVRGNCDAEVDEMISDFKFNDNIRLNINGFKAITTKRSWDFCADVVAYKDNKKLVVSCKKYVGNLGIKCVQEIIGAMDYYQTNEG